MNEFKVHGSVGKVTRKGEIVFLRLCHHTKFLNKRSGERERQEHWFSISFFGNVAKALERDIEIGDRVIVEGDMVVFPKEGPTSRVVLNAKDFYILLPAASHKSRGPQGEIDDGQDD